MNSFGSRAPLFHGPELRPTIPHRREKIERLAQIAKRRVHPAGNAAALSLEDAQRLVKGWCVEHYNSDVCSNSAIGYITPKDMVAGR